MDIEALWEYDDPELSEVRFREAAESAQGDDRLELQTQIARTLGLRGRFPEAHSALDEVERQLASAGPRVRVRYLLERGRTLNSSGKREEAHDLFMQAWEQAQAANLTGLAVDAAHMLAIASSGTPQATEWNERGLALARGSSDAKAQALIPAMLNNSAWDLHQMGSYEQALKLFEEAQTEWQKRGKPEQIRIARWSVARCLRSLGRYEEALGVQRSLEAEHIAAGTTDGYVFEEIAENLAALGDAKAAKPYFGKAYAELSKDAWLAENEKARLAHLKDGAGSG